MVTNPNIPETRFPIELFSFVKTYYTAPTFFFILLLTKTFLCDTIQVQKEIEQMTNTERKIFIQKLITLLNSASNDWELFEIGSYEEGVVTVEMLIEYLKLFDLLNSK